MHYILNSSTWMRLQGRGRIGHEIGTKFWRNGNEIGGVNLDCARNASEHPRDSIRAVTYPSVLVCSRTS